MPKRRSVEQRVKPILKVFYDFVDSRDEEGFRAWVGSQDLFSEETAFEAWREMIEKKKKIEKSLGAPKSPPPAARGRLQRRPGHGGSAR